MQVAGRIPGVGSNPKGSFPINNWIRNSYGGGNGGRKVSSASSHEDVENQQKSLLQYDSPSIFPRPVNVHASVAFSLRFRLRKQLESYNYLRKHASLSVSMLDRDTVSQDTIDVILELIRPAKILTVDGRDWKQPLSKRPSTGAETMELEKTLDQLLEQRNALMSGYCPYRRELYDECFDEVLRQIALEVPDRAVLLLRCRDELQETLRTYMFLLDTNEAYIMNKAALSTHGWKETDADNIANEVQELEDSLSTLQAEYERKEIANRDSTRLRLHTYSNEALYWKTMGDRLKMQINKLSEVEKHGHPTVIANEES